MLFLTCLPCNCSIESPLNLSVSHKEMVMEGFNEEKQQRGQRSWENRVRKLMQPLHVCVLVQWYVAIVWPDFPFFSVYKVSDWSIVDSGSARLLAWDTCRDIFALLDSALAPRMPIIPKGGSSRKTKEAAAAAATAASSASVQVRILMAVGGGVVSVKSSFWISLMLEMLLHKPILLMKLLRDLAVAGSVKEALRGHKLRGLALRLANHGELMRFSEHGRLSLRNLAQAWNKMLQKEK